MDGLIRISASAAAGAAFGFGPELAHVAVIVPFAIGAGRGRPSFGCVAAYAVPAALPAGLAAFDYTGSVGTARIAWTVPGAVFGLALGAALAAPRRWRTVSVIAVIVAVSVPPLSAITLLSPLPVAGLVFPGAGLAGLVGFVVLLGALVSTRSTPILVLASACLVASATFATAAVPIPADERGIAGVDTWRGQPDARTQGLLAGAWRTEERRLSDALGAHTVVWPEGVYGEWSALTGRMLELATPRLVGGTRTYVDDDDVREHAGRRGDGRGAVRAARAGTARAGAPASRRAGRPARGRAPGAAAALPALLCIEIANPWLALRRSAAPRAANVPWCGRRISVGPRARDSPRGCDRPLGSGGRCSTCPWSPRSTTRTRPFRACPFRSRRQISDA